MKLQFKNETTIAWRQRTMGDWPHDLLAWTSIRGSATYEGRPYNLFLAEIRAKTSDGKRCELKVSLYNSGPHLDATELDREAVLVRMRPWMAKHKMHLVHSSAWGSCYFYLSFSLQKLGFYETVIQVVSDLALALGVRKNDWFTQAYGSERTTSVLVRGKWVLYEKYVLEKYKDMFTA